MPALRPIQSTDRAFLQRWVQTIGAEFSAFSRRVDAGEDTALDPYGAESISEFFAVASEAFFASPAAMRDEHPQLYDLFADYFGQDPARDDAGSGT